MHYQIIYLLIFTYNFIIIISVIFTLGTLWTPEGA